MPDTILYIIVGAILGSLVFLINRILRFKKKLTSIPMVLVFGIFFLLISGVLTFHEVLKLDSIINKEKDKSYRFLKIGEHLQQTSDDLTKMIQGYVATGDKRFIDNYYNILDIRNGIKPRPMNYNSFLWDQVIVDGGFSFNSGEKISFEKLLEQFNLSDTELLYIKDAERKSNELAQLEMEAEKAMNGLFKDDKDRYSYIKKQPDRKYAVKIVNDKNYYNLKLRVSKSLSKFRNSVNDRIQRNISRSQQRIAFYLKILTGIIFLGLILFLLLVREIIVNQGVEFSERSDQMGADKISLKVFIRFFPKVWPSFLTAFFVCSLIVAFTSKNKLQVEQQARSELHNTLLTVLNSTHDAAVAYLDQLKKQVNLWAKSDEHVESIQGLLKVHKQNINITKTRAYKKTHNFFAHNLSKSDFVHFLVVDKSAKIILSDEREFVGRKIESNWEYEYIQSIMTSPGYTKILLPQKGAGFDLSSSYSGPLIFVGAPIVSKTGEVIACLILKVEPKGQFTSILQRGRVGKSGETYSFNLSGELLSQSRFEKDLRTIGLLDKAEDSILNIEIKDPGSNLVLNGGKIPPGEKKLTEMARSALSGESSHNLNGYADYRGVPVVGAWLWNTAYGFGMATEIDKSEAYKSLEKSNRLTDSVTALTIILIFIMTVLFSWNKVRSILNHLQITESSKRLQSLIDTAVDGIVVIDEEGLILEFSPAAEKIFGFEKDKILGQNIDLIVPNEFKELHIQGLQRFLHTGVKKLIGKSIEIIGLKSDGSHIPIELSIGVARVGGRHYFTGIIRDISERKANAEKLKLQATALQSAGTSITITNSKGKIEWANPAFTSMTGYSIDEVKGKDHRILNSNSHPREFFKKMWDKILKGEIWRGEVINKNKDGKLYNEEMTIAPVFDDKNKITNFVAIKNNITERKKAERILSHQLALTSSLVEAIPNPIFVKDSETNFTIFNKAFEEIFGVDRTKFIGKTIIDMEFLDYDTKLELQKIDESILSTGINHFQELSVPNLKDGKDSHFLYWVKRFDLEDGSIGGLVGIFVDISDQKKLEFEMAKAKELAEDATKAKSEFLANMSHEIRTPMNAVIGLTDLCLRTELSEKQEDYLNKVLSSAKSLLGVINDILDFSKIEAGKLDLETTAFNLDDVLENLATIISVKTIDKGLELLFMRNENVPNHLIGDPLRLGQVLINLCNNAVKFTENGEIDIGISLEEDFGEKVKLKFSVRDTGIGMTEKQLSKMFKSFSQADASTTRKYGGTGLGLSISKQLVELMNGHIWVESEPDVGSTFNFTVELLKDKSDFKKTFTSSLDLKGMKVLVVDDNQNARDIASTYLESLGFVPTVCSSAEEGISLLEKSDDSFGLVIVDYYMPDGMDGVEFAKEIKKSTNLKNPPVLMLVTSRGLTDFTGEDLKLFKSTINKPINPSLLFNSIMIAFGDKTAKTSRSLQRDGISEQKMAKIRGAKILLVEDNLINQQVATEILEEEYFVIDIANNGQEAIKKIRNNDYDCVLMDIQMPIMDGITATKIIREDKKFDSLPILAMTANAMSQDKENVLKVGMNEHISKPIDTKELFTALYKWIEHKDRDVKVKEKKVSNSMDVEIPLIEGIDQERGVQNVNGNKKLYQKLLLDFIEDHEKDDEVISELIAGEQLKEATRLAHTVKGISGTIGAGRLQELSGQLEDSLSDENNEEISKRLSPFKIEFNHLMLSLRQALRSQLLNTEKELDSNKKALSSEELREELEALKEMVDSMSPDSEDKINKIMPHLLNFDQRLATTLKSQIRDFDFDAALEILDLLISKIE